MSDRLEQVISRPSTVRGTLKAAHKENKENAEDRYRQVSLKIPLKKLLGNFCEKCINIPCIPVTKMFKKIKSPGKRVEILEKK